MPIKSVRVVAAVAAVPALVALVVPFGIAEDCRDHGPPWYAIATVAAVVGIYAVAAFGFTPQRWHWGVRLVSAAMFGGAASFAAYVLWVWVWVAECSN